MMPMINLLPSSREVLELMPLPVQHCAKTTTIVKHFLTVHPMTAIAFLVRLLEAKSKMTWCWQRWLIATFSKVSKKQFFIFSKNLLSHRNTNVELRHIPSVVIVNDCKKNDFGHRSWWLCSWLQKRKGLQLQIIRLLHRRSSRRWFNCRYMFAARISRVC